MVELGLLRVKRQPPSSASPLRPSAAATAAEAPSVKESAVTSEGQQGTLSTPAVSIPPISGSPIANAAEPPALNVDSSPAVPCAAARLASSPEGAAEVIESDPMAVDVKAEPATELNPVEVPRLTGTPPSGAIDDSTEPIPMDVEDGVADTVLGCPLDDGIAVDDSMDGVKDGGADGDCEEEGSSGAQQQGRATRSSARVVGVEQKVAPDQQDQAMLGTPCSAL